MSLHHGLADLRDNHLTCFTDMLYSSMVPGNLPSQLEILSTGHGPLQQGSETIVVRSDVSSLYAAAGRYYIKH